jgi:UDP-N-acetylglucosamine 2-epimerase (non-hydrolysing)
MGITDSGTVEEDLCWFRKPCVTTRISTERPETEFVGANIVSGLDAKDIAKCVEMMNERKTDWHIPYYEGTTKRIAAILKEKEDEIMQPKKWW